MFRRFIPLIVMIMALTLVLAACGDENATVPSYSGATSVTIPDTFKQQVQPSLTDQVKNGKIDAYKTSDDAKKVKDSFVNNFKKDGWNDKNSDGASVNSQFEAMGGFFILYQKGNTAAGVMGLPGSLANPMGFSGVNESDTLIFVISGQGK